MDIFGFVTIQLINSADNKAVLHKECCDEEQTHFGGLVSHFQPSFNIKFNSVLSVLNCTTPNHHRIFEL